MATWQSESKAVGLLLPNVTLPVTFFEVHAARPSNSPSFGEIRGEKPMMPLANFAIGFGNGGLLFIWMLATIMLCLLCWLAFTIRQRQYRSQLPHAEEAELLPEESGSDQPVGQGSHL